MPYFLETPELCCDVQQVMIFAENMDKMSMFKRCPSCIRNLKTHLCQMTCSENQKDYMDNIKVSEEVGNQPPNENIENADGKYLLT